MAIFDEILRLGVDFKGSEQELKRFADLYDNFIKDLGSKDVVDLKISTKSLGDVKAEFVALRKDLDRTFEGLRDKFNIDIKFKAPTDILKSVDQVLSGLQTKIDSTSVGVRNSLIATLNEAKNVAQNIKQLKESGDTVNAGKFTAKFTADLKADPAFKQKEAIESLGKGFTQQFVGLDIDGKIALIDDAIRKLTGDIRTADKTEFKGLTKQFDTLTAAKEKIEGLIASLERLSSLEKVIGSAPSAKLFPGLTEAIEAFSVIQKKIQEIPAGAKVPANLTKGLEAAANEIGRLFEKGIEQGKQFQGVTDGVIDRLGKMSIKVEGGGLTEPFKGTVSTFKDLSRVLDTTVKQAQDLLATLGKSTSPTSINLTNKALTENLQLQNEAIQKREQFFNVVQTNQPLLAELNTKLNNKQLLDQTDIEKGAKDIKDIEEQRAALLEEINAAFRQFIEAQQRAVSSSENINRSLTRQKETQLQLDNSTEARAKKQSNLLEANLKKQQDFETKLKDIQSRAVQPTLASTSTTDFTARATAIQTKLTDFENKRKQFENDSLEFLKKSADVTTKAEAGVLGASLAGQKQELNALGAEIKKDLTKLNTDVTSATKKADSEFLSLKEKAAADLAAIQEKSNKTQATLFAEQAELQALKAGGAAKDIIALQEQVVLKAGEAHSVQLRQETEFQQRLTDITKAGNAERATIVEASFDPTRLEKQFLAVQSEFASAKRLATPITTGVNQQAANQRQIDAQNLAIQEKEAALLKEKSGLNDPKVVKLIEDEIAARKLAVQELEQENKLLAERARLLTAGEDPKFLAKLDASNQALNNSKAALSENLKVANELNVATEKQVKLREKLLDLAVREQDKFIRLSSTLSKTETEQQAKAKQTPADIAKFTATVQPAPDVVKKLSDDETRLQQIARDASAERAALLTDYSNFLLKISEAEGQQEAALIKQSINERRATLRELNSEFEQVSNRINNTIVSGTTKNANALVTVKEEAGAKLLAAQKAQTEAQEQLDNEQNQLNVLNAQRASTAITNIQRKSLDEFIVLQTRRRDAAKAILDLTVQDTKEAEQKKLDVEKETSSAKAATILNPPPTAATVPVTPTREEQITAAEAELKAAQKAQPELQRIAESNVELRKKVSEQDVAIAEAEAEKLIATSNNASKATIDNIQKEIDFRKEAQKQLDILIGLNNEKVANLGTGAAANPANIQVKSDAEAAVKAALKSADEIVSIEEEKAAKVAAIEKHLQEQNAALLEDQARLTKAKAEFINAQNSSLKQSQIDQLRKVRDAEETIGNERLEILKQLATKRQAVVNASTAKELDAVGSLTPNLSGINSATSNIKKFRGEFEKLSSTGSLFDQVFKGFSNDVGRTLGTVVRFGLAWRLVGGIIQAAVLPVQLFVKGIQEGVRFLAEMQQRAVEIREVLLANAQFSTDLAENFDKGTEAAKKFAVQIELASAKVNTTSEVFERVFESFIQSGGLQAVGGDIQKAVDSTALLIQALGSVGISLKDSRRAVAEVNKLLTESVTSRDALPRALKRSSDQLADIVVNAKEAGDLFEVLNELLPNQAKSLALSDQQFGRLIDKVKVYGDLVLGAFASGLFENFIKGLQTITDYFEKNSEAVLQFAKDTGKGLSSVVNLITEVYRSLAFLKDTFAGLFKVQSFFWGTLTDLATGYLSVLNTIIERTAYFAAQKLGSKQTITNNLNQAQLDTVIQNRENFEARIKEIDQKILADAAKITTAPDKATKESLIKTLGPELDKLKEERSDLVDKLKESFEFIKNAPLSANKTAFTVLLANFKGQLDKALTELPPEAANVFRTIAKAMDQGLLEGQQQIQDRIASIKEDMNLFLSSIAKDADGQREALETAFQKGEISIEEFGNRVRETFVRERGDSLKELEEQNKRLFGTDITGVIGKISGKGSTIGQAIDPKAFIDATTVVENRINQIQLKLQGLSDQSKKLSTQDLITPATKGATEVVKTQTEGVLGVLKPLDEGIIKAGQSIKKGMDSFNTFVKDSFKGTKDTEKTLNADSVKNLSETYDKKLDEQEKYQNESWALTKKYQEDLDKYLESKNAKDYSAMIQRIAKEQGISPLLGLSLVKQESNFNPKAVSRNKETGEPIAYGLTQLKPSTAKEQGLDFKDIFDAEKNITAGFKFFKSLLLEFKGNEELALAAYNAGPKRVKDAGNKIPDIKETQDYVDKIITKYEELKAVEKQYQNDLATLKQQAEVAKKSDVVAEDKKTADERLGVAKTLETGLVDSAKAAGKEVVDANTQASKESAQAAQDASKEVSAGNIQAAKDTSKEVADVNIQAVKDSSKEVAAANVQAAKDTSKEVADVNIQAAKDTGKEIAAANIQASQQTAQSAAEAGAKVVAANTQVQQQIVQAAKDATKEKKALTKEEIQDQLAKIAEEKKALEAQLSEVRKQAEELNKAKRRAPELEKSEADLVKDQVQIDQKKLDIDAKAKKGLAQNEQRLQNLIRQFNFDRVKAQLQIEKEYLAARETLYRQNAAAIGEFESQQLQVTGALRLKAFQDEIKAEQEFLDKTPQNSIERANAQDRLNLLKQQAKDFQQENDNATLLALERERRAKLDFQDELLKQQKDFDTEIARLRVQDSELLNSQLLEIERKALEEKHKLTLEALNREEADAVAVAERSGQDFNPQPFIEKRQKEDQDFTNALQRNIRERVVALRNEFFAELNLAAGRAELYRNRIALLNEIQSKGFTITQTEEEATVRLTKATVEATAAQLKSAEAQLTDLQARKGTAEAIFDQKNVVDELAAAYERATDSSKKALAAELSTAQAQLENLRGTNGTTQAIEAQRQAVEKLKNELLGLQFAQFTAQKTQNQGNLRRFFNNLVGRNTALDNAPQQFFQQQIQTQTAARDQAVQRLNQLPEGGPEFDKTAKQIEELNQQIEASTAAFEALNTRVNETTFQKVAKDIGSAVGKISSIVSAVQAGYQQGGVAGGIGAGLSQAGAVTQGMKGALGQLSPVFAAVGAVVTLISGLFTAATKRIAESIKKTIDTTMRDLAKGAIGLGDAIVKLEQSRVDAIRRLSGRKGGQKELDQILPDLESQIASLEKQQKETQQNFQLELITLRQGNDVLGQFLRTWHDINQQVKDYVDSFPSNASTGNIAELTDQLNKAKASLAQLESIPADHPEVLGFLNFTGGVNAYNTALQRAKQTVTDLTSQIDQANAASRRFADAAEFLSLQLKKLQQDAQSQFNDAEQQAIQNAIDLNDLLQQRIDLINTYNKQRFDLLTQDSVERRQSGAVARGVELAQLTKDFNKQKADLEDQIKLKQKIFDKEKDIFHLASDTASLKARSDQLTLDNLDIQIQQWQSLKQIIEGIKFNPGTGLYEILAGSDLSKLVDQLGATNYTNNINGGVNLTINVNASQAQIDNPYQFGKSLGTGAADGFTQYTNNQFRYGVTG